MKTYIFRTQIFAIFLFVINNLPLWAQQQVTLQKHYYMEYGFEQAYFLGTDWLIVKSANGNVLHTYPANELQFDANGVAIVREQIEVRLEDAYHDTQFQTVTENGITKQVPWPVGVPVTVEKRRPPRVPPPDDEPGGGSGPSDVPLKRCWYCECDQKKFRIDAPHDEVSTSKEDGSCVFPTKMDDNHGMADYSINKREIDFTLHDSPFSYESAFGPSISPSFMYTPDIDRMKPERIPHLSMDWKLNLVRFIIPATPESPLRLETGKGGQFGFKQEGNTLKPEGHIGLDEIKLVGVDSYEHRLTNGSVETYSYVKMDNGWKRIFLSSYADKWGNVVSFTYVTINNHVRLTKVTDATGHAITFQYEAADDLSRITGLTDPHGRKMTIGYDPSGRLVRLTDPVGVQSEFRYAGLGDKRIEALITPYGETQFVRANVMGTFPTTPAGQEEPIGSYLEVTDPENRVYRIENRERIPASAFGAETLPFVNGAAYEVAGEYTLFWPPAAPRPLQITDAHAVQWHQEGGEPTGAIASIKRSGENRVIYTYSQPVVSSGPGTDTSSYSSHQMMPDQTVKIVEKVFTPRGKLWTVSESGGRKIRNNYGITQTGHMSDELEYVSAHKNELDSEGTKLVSYSNYHKEKARTITAMDGKVTTTDYNTRGQLVSATGPDGNSIVVTYNETVGSPAFGRVVSQTAVIGPIATPIKTLTTQLFYDAYGRVNQITNPENETVTMEYDAINGDPLKTLDRVSKVIYPSGKSERVEWWALSVKKTFDIEDKATVYEIDGNGEVESVKTPDEKTITYERGNCCGGAIDTLVDAGNNRTHWKHDVMGRVTEKWLKWDPNHPDGSHSIRVAAHTYDELGRPSTTTDARGNTRTVVYDAEGRMSEINYTIPALLPDGSPNPTAPTPNVTITYETMAESVFGRVKTVSQAGGANLETYEYVPVNPTDTVYGDGQLKKVDKPGSHSTTYTYDARGRRETSTLDVQSHAAGVVTSRSWDALGRLTKLTNPLGTEEIHYDGDTGRVTWTKLGVVKSVYGYDTSVPGEHRLSGISHSWNDDFQPYTNHGYSYDPSGRLASWTRTIPQSGHGSHWDMEYDASEQLQGVSILKWDAAITTDEHFYQYDAAGNRTSEQRGAVVRSWEKNEVNQLTLQSVGGAMVLKGEVNVPSNVTVTPEGGGTGLNAASAATKWKAKVNVGAGVNRFSVTATQANVPQGQTAQSTTRMLQVNQQPEVPINYTYDADGNLTTDGLNYYTWDAENRLVGIWNSAFGAVEFGYDAFNRRVSLVETFEGVALRTLKLLWEGLTIVGQVDTTQSVNEHTRLFFGNGERRLSHAGAPLNLLYTRDHLGSIREVVNATNAAIRARYDYSPYGIRTKVSGDLDADFGYTGHYTNGRSGLVLAPYRAYSPELGRWISRDPIEEDGGINLYGYVGGDPLGYVDPDGLKEKPFNAGVDKPLSIVPGSATPAGSGTKLNIDGSISEPSYNCHSFAWYGSKGDNGKGDFQRKGFPFWVNDPRPAFGGATSLGAGTSNKVGDIFTYGGDRNGNGFYEPNEIDHSAVVSKVDKNGNATEVTGKSGEGPICKSHPLDPAMGYGPIINRYRPKTPNKR